MGQYFTVTGSMRNWSRLVLVTSLASCSLSWASPVPEAVASYGYSHGYGRGYTGHYGYRSRSPRVYTGRYNRGYQGYRGRHGYHTRHKAHGSHVFRQAQQRVALLPQKEVDRFIPADRKPAGQRVFSEGGVSPSPAFRLEIGFDDETRDISSEPFTNSVENKILDAQSETEELVTEPAMANNVSAEQSLPVLSTTQQRLLAEIRQQTQQQAQQIDNIVSDSMGSQRQEDTITQNTLPPIQSSPPPPTDFKFPPRLAPEQFVLPSVQQTKPTVQQAVPTVQQAVPTVQQTVPTVQQTVPTVQQTVLAAQQAVPTVQQTVLTTQQAAPTVQQAVGSLQEAVPNLLQPLPVLKQPSLPVQSPSVQTPVLPPPVLGEVVPAVPGRPVLEADAVQPVQPIPSFQSSFIPMPVPAVPGL